MNYRRYYMSFKEYLNARLDEIFDGREPEDLYEAEQAVTSILEEYYEVLDDGGSWERDESEKYREKEEAVASLV